MTRAQPNSEEKFWATLGHLAAFTGGVGLMIPAYGWIENRKTSAYAAFQSLQALCYQSLGYTLWAIIYLLVLIVVTIVTLPPLMQSATTGSAALGPWFLTHALLIFGLYAIYLALPLIGAIRCILGREFQYPWLGIPLAHYIGYGAAGPNEALSEEREDRFMAAMGHFCIIYPLWGLLVPLSVLITQGARSRFLKFQTLQALVFQFAAGVLSLLLGVAAFGILLASVVPFIAGRNLNSPPIESLLGFMLFLICLGVLVLVAPLLQILGQWAGLRILQGHDYRYPVVGRLVASWLAKREGQAE
jgi:uncharacterized Tic20 family protein